MFRFNRLSASTQLNEIRVKVDSEHAKEIEEQCANQSGVFDFYATTLWLAEIGVVSRPVHDDAGYEMFYDLHIRSAEDTSETYFPLRESTEIGLHLPDLQSSANGPLRLRLFVACNKVTDGIVENGPHIVAMSWSRQDSDTSFFSVVAPNLRPCQLRIVTGSHRCEDYWDLPLREILPPQE